MRYVQRDPETGKVIGHYENEQPYARELLPDDHPDILEWASTKWLGAKAGKAPTHPELLLKRIEALEKKIADLEAQVAELKVT